VLFKYKTLALQLALIVFAVLAISSEFANFPYPSPLIRPFLPPKLRWPTDQVIGWVEIGQIDREFAKFFSRDPERKIPAGDNMVSAADGVVQRVDFRDGATHLVVGLSFWDVHIVRTPLEGVVKDVEPIGTWYDRAMPGSRSPADTEKVIYLEGKAAPVQQVVTIATKLGDIRVRLITSYWASRLRVWVRPGQHVAKGERIGRILLGSTVVVAFPGKVDLSVMLRQHVSGGETIIGSLSP
jgi:phosphatidylserine decarboxylase